MNKILFAALMSVFTGTFAADCNAMRTGIVQGFVESRQFVMSNDRVHVEGVILDRMNDLKVSKALDPAFSYDDIASMKASGCIDAEIKGGTKLGIALALLSTTKIVGQSHSKSEMLARIDQAKEQAEKELRATRPKS